ncbi:MAG: glycosyltransferase family 2 protein [Lachnospiraceae bacterium]|nr:glycosyltransferase family 2 protein [Lachnospiraceae bacterium]
MRRFRVMESAKGKKISVIIPVYNKENYICDCVKSVLEQTYADFELLLIDDGSEDNSGEICKKFSGDDKRIRYIRQKHRGVSSARNAGIEKAEGKYLFFLDCDDMIHPQLLEALYKLQEENHTAIAVSGMYPADGKRENKPAEWRKTDETKWEGYCLDSAGARSPMVFTRNDIKLDAIGGKMILRESLKTIRFDEKFSYGEDTLFLYRMLAQGADVSVLMQKWYYYRNSKKKKDLYFVKACTDRYEVKRYICGNEIKEDNISNAVDLEGIILSELMLWRHIGRKYGDRLLTDYVKHLISEEKKLWIFSRLQWYEKIMFYLGCKNYLLYRLIFNTAQWYRDITGSGDLK